MFSDFHRIAKAIESGSLKKEWNAMVGDRMSRPWDGHSLSGHVPFSDLQHAQNILREPFVQKGLYVWGGWAGTAARLQYVGIAHDKPFGIRFVRRYVGATQGTELSLAVKFSEQFASLPDDFSPHKRVDPEKYRRVGIAVPSDKNRYRRLSRAERYAKVGLENLWFFLIPAPPEASKAALADIEKELIKISTALMFQLNAGGGENGWPLLNIVHARSTINPYAEAGQEQKYLDWLGGSWWRSVPTA